jgi:hypothetical protein
MGIKAYMTPSRRTYAECGPNARERTVERSPSAPTTRSNRSVVVDPSTVWVSVTSTPSASWTMLDGTVEKRMSTSPGSALNAASSTSLRISM